MLYNKLYYIIVYNKVVYLYNYIILVLFSIIIKTCTYTNIYIYI